MRFFFKFCKLRRMITLTLYRISGKASALVVCVASQHNVNVIAQTRTCSAYFPIKLYLFTIFCLHILRECAFNRACLRRLKMASSRKRSPMWRYFYIFEEDNKMAVCFLCNNKISRGGEGKKASTTAMKNHLKNKHAEQYATITEASSINGNTKQFIFKQTTDQEQASSSSFPDVIHEEEDIKPDLTSIDTEEEKPEETEEAPQVEEQQATVPRRVTRPNKSIHFHRKPIFSRTDRSVVREDEFDVYAKHVATQLRQLPLDVALLCQNEIQTFITKARVKALNADKENGENAPPSSPIPKFKEENDEFGTFGSYVGIKLRNMKYSQQSLAEDLMLKVILKGKSNKLSKDTDISDTHNNGMENGLSDHTNDEALTDITNTYTENGSSSSQNDSIQEANGITQDVNNMNIQVRTFATNVTEANLRKASNVAGPSNLSNDKKRKKRRLKSPSSTEPEHLYNLTPSEDIDRQEELNINELSRLSPVFVTINPQRSNVPPNKAGSVSTSAPQDNSGIDPDFPVEIKTEPMDFQDDKT